ncbi:MAG: V-type ATP synthase subunit I [Oscillospiraceae bacterium]|nr:V-type ATP synthase subunit I [Oscillospiraceae bacterium]
MAIVKMKKLRLLAVRSQRDALLGDLVLLGCVEVSEPDAEAVAAPQAFAARDIGALAKCRQNLTLLTSGLAVMDRYAPSKSGFLSLRPEVSREDVLSDEGLERSLALARELEAREARLRKLQAEESQQTTAVQALLPWQALSLPLEMQKTQTCDVLLGTTPAAVDVIALQDELAAEVPEAELLLVNTDKELRYLEAVCLRSVEEDVMKILRSHGFALVTMPAESGTVQQAIAAARERVTAVQTEQKAVIAEITELAQQRLQLKTSIDGMSARLGRADAVEKLENTESAFYMEGWIPADEEERLAAALAAYDCAWETEEPDPEKPEEVPVKLKNNALTEPLDVLTGMYGYPSYKGVDPNPLMLPFFPLFFGLMFADAAYGLMLIIAGLVVKKSKPKGGFKCFSGLMIECGFWATLFGILFGGFFGDAIEQIIGMFNPELSARWADWLGSWTIDSMTNAIYILVIALILGVIQLLTGVIINGYMLARDGDKAGAFWAVAPVFVCFIGIGLGALGVTWIVAIISVLMIIWAEGRESKSIGGKIGSGLYGLYNFASGWFGDILSYSRLMALMLAGSVIASVFNQLGAMFGPVAFIFVFLIGHALNIALNLIGCFVHALRLQYLEYFGKFYREGGRLFNPLSIKTKYVDIKEE